MVERSPSREQTMGGKEKKLDGGGKEEKK